MTYRMSGKSFPRETLSFVLISLLILLAGCTSAPGVSEKRPRESFSQLIDLYLADPALQIAHVGIFIQDPSTRRIIYHRNQYRLFIPASNQKLITTAAALSRLGPDYRYKTELYTDGKIENGILQGNLYIKGSGDPTLSGRFHNGNRTKDLENWADSLSEVGIATIQGDIIADPNIFDSQHIGPGWAYDDLSYWYAAEISGLSFNDNCIDINISPGDSIGAPALLDYRPKTGYITLENNIITVPKDSITHYDYYRYPGTNRIRLYGKISQNKSEIKDYVTIHKPALFTATVFSDVLAGADITLNGVVRETSYQDTIPEYRKMTELVVYNSPPLSEIISVINKRSQNFYADQLFKTLGFDVTGHGSFAAGQRAVRGFLAGIGVQTGQMSVADGSGLSRRNLISPSQIGAVLRYMYYSKYSDYYVDSLPVGGINGTLNHRFRGSVAIGRVNAKTGSMSFVRSLSGYVRTKDNRALIFSILVNNYTTNRSVIDEFQDAMISLIADQTYEELIR